MGYAITRAGLIALYGVAMAYHKKAYQMYALHIIAWGIGLLRCLFVSVY